MFKPVAFVIFSLCFLVKLKTINASDNVEVSEINYRLPSSVNPINYTIELITYLDTNDEKSFTFNGTAIIHVEVIEETDNITIHTSELKFKNEDVSVRDTVEDKDMVLSDITYEPIKNFTIIKATKFEKGRTYRLKFKYTGLVNDGLKGFYRSSYKDEKGQKV